MSAVMKKSLYLTLAGVLAYVFFLVLLLPADRVYGLARDKGLAPFDLYQINGSLWSGSAAALRIGTRRLEGVEWRLRPAALLSGRMELSLGFDANGRHVALIAAYGLPGDYSLSSGDQPLPVEKIETLINPQPLGLNGEVEMQLDNIRLDKGRLVGLEGLLRWRQAGIGAPLNVTIGSFEMTFETQDDGIHGVLKDVSGPLQLDGSLLLKPDGNYRLAATFVSRDRKRSDISQALRLIGTPSPDGKVSMTRSGRLNLKKLLKL